MKSSTPQGSPLARVRLESVASRRWKLLCQGTTIDLPPAGVVILGRSPRCDVVIDHTSVSRTHCRIEITSGGAVVEDLRSSNGLYVNGEREKDRRPLTSGDRLLLGTQEVIVFTAGNTTMEAGVPDQAPPTIDPPEEIPEENPSVWRKGAALSERSAITTQKADAFETLGRLADRMLAAGRSEAAARILSGHMRAALAGARSGRPIPEEVVEGSLRYALKLASARDDGSWLDFVLEFCIARRSPPSSNHLVHLQSLLARGLRCDPKLLAECKHVVKCALLDGTFTDRALVEALLAVESR